MTTTTTSFRELVNDLISSQPDESNEVLAAQLLLSLNVNRRALDVLMPIIAEEVGHARRAVVRDIERRAITPGQRNSVSTIAMRQQLVDEGFWRLNGKYYQWGTATVEDHEARIAWYRVHIAGCEAAVARHEKAIADIREAGVTCLAEIGAEEER